MGTLTFDYSDQVAVLGPLATYAEPHGYDLCAPHAERLSAPRGWDVIRLATYAGAAGQGGGDLEAIADAVREEVPAQPTGAPSSADIERPGPPGRRGRLRAGPTAE